MVLNEGNRKEAGKYFSRALQLGLDFKLQEKVKHKGITDSDITTIIGNLPENGITLDALLDEFTETILPYCTNFSSSKFMGFPDSGNSVAAITGNIIGDFLQQNLINQSFCAPSATYVEITVLQWLRETVGYSTNNNPRDIWDVGGIITPGGTSSNTTALLLARENKVANTMKDGVSDPSNYKIIVPAKIGHYSVKSAQMWLGCGNNLIEIETTDFRYNLPVLKKALLENKGKVMAVIAYVGDSRTMTIDNLEEIVNLVRRIDPRVWLHADACHGFSLGFSKSLRHHIKGIENFDSISIDPHKVLLIPYTLSALLIKDPEKLKMITSLSDLIMQEPFAFGQITPFIGSKPWLSLKLWFMMKNFGKSGLDELITNRHNLAVSLAKKLAADSDFAVLNEVQINSVAFFYTRGGTITDTEEINRLNVAIHNEVLKRGDYHLHQFSIPDRGLFQKGASLSPLRFMSGNPNVTESNLDELIDYVRSIGHSIV